MSPLVALLESIKIAPGPSRELDAELWLMDMGYDKRGDFNPSTVFWTEVRNHIAMQGNSPMRAVPRYTGSLDAILALIEKHLPNQISQLIGEALILWGHDAALNKRPALLSDLPRFCAIAFIGAKIERVGA